MFAVEETLDLSQRFNDVWGGMIFIGFVLFVLVFGVFMIIMYFVRRKTMTKAERRPKVLKLP